MCYVYNYVTVNIAAAKILLDWDADLNAKDNGNMSPLAWAIENGFEDVSKLLIERGADVNGEGGEFPLLVAIKNGNENIAKCLILQGAIVNFSDLSDGNTALHLAAKLNMVSLVQQLLESVENVLAKNQDGHTALDIAKKQSVGSVPFFARFDIAKHVSDNNLEGVQWALEKGGADVNTVDEVLVPLYDFQISLTNIIPSSYLTFLILNFLE